MEVTLPPRGPFLGLTVDRIALRILTTHPSSTQPWASLSSTTQPSTLLLGRLCVQLLVDRPGPILTSHFQLVLRVNDSLSLKACQCLQMHSRADGHMDF